MSPDAYPLTEVGPLVPFVPGRPTVGLLNANPFAEGIANLGAQVVARGLLEAEFNVEFGFADTVTSKRPFIANHARPDECTLLAVSVPFEDTYHHVPRMLASCGVSPWAERRGEDDPIVVAGGMALINPMPLSPFFDAMVLGEGREVLVRAVEQVLEGRRAAERRQDLLRRLAQVPHVYVPSLYDLRYDHHGSVVDFSALDPAPPTVTVARPLDMQRKPIHSVWTSPRACYKYDDYFSVMVAMGCHLKCPFCVVGQVQGADTGKALNITLEQVVALSDERRAAYGTNLIKLFFASSFSKQTAIDPLGLKNLLAVMLQHGFECRVGSLNVRQADEELLELVRRAGQERVTFAPETAEGLRTSIGKSYSRDEKIIGIAGRAGALGMGLDLYTMLGLPEERPHHVRELVGLIDPCRRALAGRATLEVSINPVFAKAQTPYERYATVRPEVVRHRFAYLRSLLSTEDGIEWVSVVDDPMCYYQPILALGGPELAPVLAALSDDYYPSEARWRAAVWEHVGSDERYFRERPGHEVLPWQHLVYNDHQRLLARFDMHRRKAVGA